VIVQFPAYFGLNCPISRRERGLLNEVAMKAVEYIVSLLLSILLIGAAVAWTQAASKADETARVSCRPGTSARAVVLKGMSVYPHCPGGKRG
jgi:hypothetical protein